MGEYSNYPNQIDTSNEIPKATDNVTPVRAESVNRIREAVLFVEAELGQNPSGTYGTVAARLDAMETGGGGGGGGAIDVAENGTTIDPNAAFIDFVGSVSVVTTSPTRVRVTIGQPTVQRQVSFTPTLDQTVFTLPDAPAQANAVVMYLNGLKLQYNTDYVVVGSTATYDNSEFALATSDAVEFWYLVSTTIEGSGSVSVLEVPVVNIDDTDSPYTITSSDYMVAADSTSGAITINLPSSPVTGRSVEVKDVMGTSLINNITVNGNGAVIDGVATYIIADNNESITLRFTGVRWSFV